MNYLDLTLPTPEENLALDEALLDWCEQTGSNEVLRFWESTKHFVVVGYGNRLCQEVNLETCHERNIPVLRRCSGGGTVLQGPGCLNYSLLLNMHSHDALQTIPETNRYVMERQRAALIPLLGATLAVQGHTDLTIGPLKFSGNAQRRKRRCLIFHGTLLLHFDLSLIDTLLKMPPLEPDYRKKRPHSEFVTNLNRSSEEIKAALQSHWSASAPLKEIPCVKRLVMEKYARTDWNYRY